MVREECERVLERFVAEILLPAIAGLASRREEIGRGVDEFDRAIQAFVPKMRAEFLRFAEFESIESSPAYLRGGFYFYFVYHFNEMLGEDFPFVLTLTLIRNRERYYFAVMRRDAIFCLTGREEPAAIIPVCVAETERDMQTVPIRITRISQDPKEFLVES